MRDKEPQKAGKDKSQKKTVASRLLSLRAGIRPDDVTAHYSTKGIQLSIRLIGSEQDKFAPSVLIEGDRSSLVFLADLLLAQASDPLDCGFEISFPARLFFSPKGKYGLYIHALPCPGHPVTASDTTRNSKKETQATTRK